jgi:hypothetical protein
LLQLRRLREQLAAQEQATSGLADGLLRQSAVAERLRQELNDRLAGQETASAALAGKLLRQGQALDDLLRQSAVAERLRQELNDRLAGQETASAALAGKLLTQEAWNAALDDKRSTQEALRQALTAQVVRWEADHAALERQLEQGILAVEVLAAQWQQLTTGTAWAVLQTLCRIRFGLLPRGSWRERLARACLRGLRRVRRVRWLALRGRKVKPDTSAA